VTGTNTARHRPLSAYGTVAGEFSSDVVSVGVCVPQEVPRSGPMDQQAGGLQQGFSCVPQP